MMSTCNPSRHLQSAVNVLAALLLVAPTAWADIVPGGSGQLDGRSVSAYVERDAALQVVAVGLKFSGDLVHNPPAVHDDVSLALPLEAGTTAFTHLQIGFEPTGHPPIGTYSFPHFDFHFYTIPEADRLNIAGGPAPADPGAQYRPASYDPPAGIVPQMGSHSYDHTGPEFNGGSFSKTFMYGFYDSQIAFLEPAATPGYLGSVASIFEEEIRQPSQFALPAMPTLFPTRWRIAYDAANDEYSISVRQFVTAVPEPSSITLFSVAIVGFGLAVRRCGRRR